MPPQQNYEPAPPAPEPEQYDFIVDSNKHKPTINLIKVGSFKSRLIVAIGGAILLIIAIWVFISVLSNASTAPTAPLIAITQEQNELARISLTPAQSATEQPTQTFAITTNLSMQSEQQAFLAFLQTLGSTPSSSVQQATRNPKTDAALLAAQTDDTYDQTYISIAQSELTTYENTLKQTFANTKNTNERILLNTAYKQAELLMQQSTQTE
ncbi:MAG: hypothetical protein ACREF5_01365 [Candidatus Saccharimonadales bacterium]